MKKLILFLLSIGIGMQALAQSDSLSTPEIDTSGICRIRAITWNSGDSVVIRWAPTQPAAWRLMANAGYIIERATLHAVDSVFTLNPRFERLTPSPVKPLPLEAWPGVALRDSLYGPIAAQCLYGKEFVTGFGDNINKIMERYNEEQNRWAFALLSADLSPVVATALGLKFTDTSTRKRRGYVYRIFSLLDPAVFPSDTGYVYVNMPEIDTVPAAPALQPLNLEHNVMLTWEGNPAFSGYFLERSADQGQSYQRLNRLPLLNQNESEAAFSTKKQIFLDSLPENYQTYWYRLAGVTPFGEKSAYSEPVTGFGRDLTPPYPPVITEVKFNPDLSFTLTWEKESLEADLKGYILEKAPSYDGPFKAIHQDILPPQTRNYEDRSADFFGENHYRLTALDTAGNISYSFKAYGVVEDSIPPAIPTNLQGEIDSSGVVTLHWPLGPEPDIIGYRVYFSNDPERRFANLTGYPVQDTLFRDTVTLKTLTPKVYYKICAVDRNFNHSQFSEIIALTRLDTIAPDAPVWERALVTDTVVYLSWIPSSAKDAETQRLYQRPQGADQWTLIAQLPSNVKNYPIRQLPRKEFFEFTLDAVDRSKNASGLAYPVMVRVYDTGIRASITSLNATYDTTKATVTLEWAYPPETTPDYFVIYRSNALGQMVSYKSVEGRKNTFQDSALLRKGQYQYAVKAKFRDGGESPMSSKATVFSE